MRVALVWMALCGVAACGTANGQSVAMIRARAPVDLSCTTGDIDVSRRPGTMTYDVLACGRARPTRA
jgi:hypothetical protein